MAVCPPEELQVSFCTWLQPHRLHCSRNAPSGAMYLHGLSYCSWLRAGLYKLLQSTHL